MRDGVKTDFNDRLIGAPSFDEVARARINDLLSAIGRYINEPITTRDTLTQVKLWAVELNEQIDLVDTLMIYQ